MSTDELTIKRSDTFLTFVSIEERAQDPSDETAQLVAAEQDIIDNVLGEAIGYPTIAELHVVGTSTRLADLEARQGAATEATPRDVCAFLLDRADQYDTKSPCWIALSDHAAAIMQGDVQAAKDHGELDAALYDRVDRMAKQTPTTATPPTVDAATANLHAMMSDGLDRLTLKQTAGLAPMADHVQSTILSWAQGAQSDIVDMLGAENRSAVPASYVVLFRGAMDAMATCARTLGHSEQQVLELVSAAYRKPTVVVVPVDAPVGPRAKA